MSTEAKSESLPTDEQINDSIKASIEPLLLETRRIGQLSALHALQEKVRGKQLGATSPELEAYISGQIDKHLNEGGDVLRTWVKAHLPGLKK